MATSFNKNYTELSTINSGNQIQDGDTILGSHTTCALQNTAHLKELTNNMVVRNAVIQNNKLVLTLATKENNDASATTTTLELDASDLNCVEHIKNITGQDGYDYTATITNGGDYIDISIHSEYYDEDEGTTDEYNSRIRFTRTSLSSLMQHNNVSTEWNLRTHPLFLNIKNNPDSQTAVFTLNAFLTLQLPVSSIYNMGSLENYIPDNTIIAMNGVYIPPLSSTKYIVAGFKLDKANDKAKLIYYDTDNSLVETILWINYSDFSVSSSRIDY